MTHLVRKRMSQDWRNIDSVQPREIDRTYDLDPDLPSFQTALDSLHPLEVEILFGQAADLRVHAVVFFQGAPVEGDFGRVAVWRDASKGQSLGAERQKLVGELEPLEFEWARRAESA